MFFLYWKLVRLRDILSSNTDNLTYMLNNCGWTFREGDNNHKYYIHYQRKEELEHLCTWVCNQIYSHNINDISDDIIDYAIYIANEIYKEIKQTLDYMQYSPRKDMGIRMACNYINSLNQYNKRCDAYNALKYLRRHYSTHKVCILENNVSFMYNNATSEIIEFNTTTLDAINHYTKKNIFAKI